MEKSMDQETQQRSQGSGIPGEMNISDFIESEKRVVGLKTYMPTTFISNPVSGI
jgi:hypothetical protein